MPRKKITDTENQAAAAAEVKEKKTAAKKAETAEVKEEVKAAEVKTEEAKEEVPKKAAPKKKAAEKKAEAETTVTIQFQGKDIEVAQLVEKAREAFTQANPDVQIATLDVYIKPEEGVAYYAVNGEGSAEDKIEL